MAKARPSLDVAARPVSTFVAPNQNAVAAELYDQQAVQNALQFADAFSNLSVSAAKLAGALKQQSNEEEILKGQDLVNQSRRSYQQLVSEGQIKPTENPWFAIGAQKASGAMEAAKARANFETLLEKKIQEDPNFLDDPRGFDAFAYQYTQNVNQLIGDASYMSRSFYESFNPFVGAMQVKHEQRVIDHNNKKIFDGASAAVILAVDDLASLPVPFEVAEIPPEDEVNAERRRKYDEASKKAEEFKSKIDAIEVAAMKTRGRLSMKDLEDQSALYSEMRVHLITMMENSNLQTPVPGGQPTRDILNAAQKRLDEFALSGAPSHQVNMAVANALLEEMKSGDNPMAAMYLLANLRGGTGKLIHSKEVGNAYRRALPEIRQNSDRLTNVEFGRVTEVMDKEILPQVLDGSLSYEEGLAKVRQIGSRYTGAKGIDGLLTRYEGDYNRAKAQQEKAFQEAQSNAVYSVMNEAQTNPDRTALRQKIADLKLPPEQEFRATELFDRVFEQAEGTRQLNAAIAATKVLWNGTGNGDGILPDLQTALTKAAAPNDSSIPDFGKYSTQIDQFATRTLGMVSTETKYKEYRLRASQQLQDSIDQWTAGFAPDPSDNEQVAKYKAQMRYKGLAMQMSVAARFDDPSRLDQLYKDVLQELNPQVVETDNPMPATQNFIMAYKFARENNQSISAIMPTGENGKALIQMMDYAVLRVRKGDNIKAVAQDISQRMSLNAPFGTPIDLQNPLGWMDVYGNDKATKEQIEGVVTDLHNEVAASGGGQLDPDAIPYLDYVFRSEYSQQFQENGMMGRFAATKTLDTIRANYAFVRGSILPRSALGSKNEAYVEAWLNVNFPNNPNATLVVLSPPGAGEAIFGVRERGQPVINKYYTINDITSPATPEGRKVFEKELDKAVLQRKNFMPLTTGQALSGFLYR